MSPLRVSVCLVLVFLAAVATAEEERGRFGPGYTTIGRSEERVGGADKARGRFGPGYTTLGRSEEERVGIASGGRYLTKERIDGAEKERFKPSFGFRPEGGAEEERWGTLGKMTFERPGEERIDGAEDERGHDCGWFSTSRFC